MRLPLVMVVVGLAGTASADPVRAQLGSPCQRASVRVAAGLDAVATVQPLIGRRCEKDRWSREAQACLTAAGTSVEAQRCLEKLTKDQRTALEGDADRLGDVRLQKWLARRAYFGARPALPPNITPNITLAVFTDAPDIGRARLLQKQGVSAYQAGRYDFAVRKLSAALDENPTPELVYHVAQAYRLKGDRARALEHYERYLEVAPDGAAANACRAQIEKLRDDVP